MSDVPSIDPQGLINLFVSEIREFPQSALQVAVSEGLLGPPESINWDGVDLGEGRPISITEASRHFRIFWDHYVAYVVTNESYALPGPAKTNLVRRTASPFLEFVRTTTWCDDEIPGPDELQHWTLISLTHIIDVVSGAAPRVEIKIL